MANAYIHELTLPRFARAAVGLIVLAFSMNVHAALFRYYDDSGDLVLSTTIPADRVKYGYDIVDNYSNLIERVEPQMSDGDYQKKLLRDASIEECKKMLKRVRGLYQFASDIDYAQEQAQISIDERITNIRASLSVATNQRQEFETQAAQLDIAGQPIPNELLDNIFRAKSQERNFTDQVEERLSEKEALKSNHEYEHLVFQLENCNNGLPAKPEQQ